LIRCVRSGSQTRGPRAACGPRERFVRPAMLFGKFQRINIYIIYVIVYSPVFKSGRLASEHIPNKRTNG